MSCAETKLFLQKNCGLLQKLKTSIINKKQSDSCEKDCFLVQKAQILVEVTGLEPAASCSQTARHRFFASFYVLFRAFSSETRAFLCREVHNSHVVQTCKWSRLWSDLKPHITHSISHEPQAPARGGFFTVISIP